MADEANLDALDLTSLVTKPSEAATLSLALFYGPPGGGKSHLALSAVEVEALRPLLVIDTEGSTVGTAKKFAKYDDDVKIVPVKTHEGFMAVMKAVLDDNIVINGEKFTPKTVIIDTLDVAQERAFNAVRAEMLHTTGKDDTRGAYGELRTWSNMIVEKLRDANFFAIITTHVKTEEMETGGTKVGINLLGGARDTIPGVPDLVAYVTRNDGVTTAMFETARKTVSKNRHGLPAEMDDPSLSKIHSIATGKEN